MIENRAVGIKSREVYEAPAAIVLIQAHSALEDVVLTKDEARIKRGLEQRWTELVYEGLWFSPAREAIDAFVDKTQELVEGDVRVELRPNAAVVTGRLSPHMLYAEKLASYGTGETFPHGAAQGFIEISSLEVELAAARARAKTERMTLWGGRVGRPLDPAVSEFLRADDAELLPYDCEATAVHARRLHAAGLLDDGELEEVEQRLRELAARRQVTVCYLAPTRTSTPRIERLLGDVGRKIHAGRSRNDQVAAAFRLYVADACVEARRGHRLASPASCSTAPRPTPRRRCPATRTSSARSPSPSAITCSRGWRCSSATSAASRPPAEAAADSPLGAGALAGSTLPLPAPERQLRNSLDAVADRDFALDYLYAAARLLRPPLPDRRGARPLDDRRVRLRRAARGGGDRLVDDAAEAQPGRRRARAREGGDGDRAAHRPARDRQGPAARLRPRPAGGQAAGLRRPRATCAARSAALAVLIGGLELDRERLAAAASDPLLLATDAAEALVRDGHAVPRRARAGRELRARGQRSTAPEQAPRPAPGPGGVRDAIAAARARLALLL